MKKKLLILLSLSGLSGIFYTLSQPNFNLWFLSFFYILPAHIYARKNSGILIWFLSNFFAWFGTVWWVTIAMTEYGGIPWPLAFLVLCILSAGISVFHIPFYLRFKLKIPFAFSDPLLIVSIEFIKTYALSGFPWSLLGYSLWEKTEMIQIADLTGVYGVSFFVASVSGFICDMYDYLFEGKRLTVIPSTLFCILLTLSVFVYGKSRISQISDIEKKSESIAFIVAQGNVDQNTKWDDVNKLKNLENYISLTEVQLSATPVKLVVWPETALTFFLTEKDLYNKLKEFVERYDLSVVAGAPAYEIKDGKILYYNRAYIFKSNSEKFYDKIHLVPFSERIPLRSVLERIPFVKRLIKEIEKVAGDFEKGKEAKVFDDGFKFSVFICYESIFPNLVRKFVKNGSELLLNITNDAWFGRSQAPYQHFSMAVLRAVETRRYIIRSANTGISGIIAPTGEVLKTTDIFVEDSFSGFAKKMDVKSFYVKYGDIFSFMCVFVVLLFLLIKR